jgi:hypothetical protein
MIITDPRLIPEAAGPLIVSKGGGVDVFSRLIRWRTKSWCEHSMLFLNPGHFVWEGPADFYKEGPMDGYMVPNVVLKFYRLVDMNADADSALRAYVDSRIKSPWYNKLYDWVGIFGEAVGLPKIHTPGLEYCSVDAIHALHTIMPYLPYKSRVVLASIPPEENPGYLDRVMANSPDVFELYGTYTYSK